MALILPASTRQKGIALLMLAGSLVYLTGFVSRGWISHDEGMLGQSAERVLRGQLPHVDYEEPYTGGLSWIYAQVFRVSGTELLHIRWLLFAVAVVAVCTLYVLLRRFVNPVGAAVASWVGLAWSFPNYFAGLPSWWLLTCALGCMWAMVRYIETRRLQYVALVGATAGTAVVIKQTGIYLIVAVLLTLAYIATGGSHAEGRRRPAAAAAAILSALFAAALIGRRLFGAEGLYLFCPVAACSAAMLVRPNAQRQSASDVPGLRLWMVVCAAFMVPVAVLLLPYVAHGALVQFVNGAFVLPRKRLEFASFPMAPAVVIITGVPLLGLVMPLSASMAFPRSRVTQVLIWAAAIILPISALWSVFAYQLIWQSTRALAAMLPLAICYCLMTGKVQDTYRSSLLYMTATILAWMSMNQFPFASPIYFSYVTPLAVIAGVALACSTASLRIRSILPWTLMVLLFALVSMHRSYVEELGFAHVPRHFDTPLDLPRAHLSLEQEEASVYRRTVGLIEQHRKKGRLVAGPDSPELYYLTGTQSESGRLFDFFSGSDSSLNGAASEWTRGQVIVINHRPAFSAMPDAELVGLLRRDFPDGEQIGRFEVRWR